MYLFRNVRDQTGGWNVCVNLRARPDGSGWRVGHICRTVDSVFSREHCGDTAHNIATATEQVCNFKEFNILGSYFDEMNALFIEFIFIYTLN